MLLDRELPADLSVQVTIDFRGDGQARDAGILFRTTGPSVGYDAQRDYFVGLIPSTSLLILGKTDGRHWTEPARGDTDIDPAEPQRLQVDVRGHHITAMHNGRVALVAEDRTYSTGQVGLRVVNTHVIFSAFQIANDFVSAPR